MKTESKYMVRVEEARLLLQQHGALMPVAEIPLLSARGRIVAQDIHSPHAMPPFRQSAMDGYALIFEDVMQNNSIVVVGEVSAGKIHDSVLRSGQAVRIYTGAAVPYGADSVVEQERVTIIEGKLQIRAEGLKHGCNIREAGSQIAKGDLAIHEGTLVTPPVLGFIAGLGLAKIKVYDVPRISIVVTGSELLAPGSSLDPGKVFESNSVALQAAILQMDLSIKRLVVVKDDLALIKKTFHELLTDSDVILFTGGISVGDYDLIRILFEEEEVENIFYKIRQKPGKPIWFGKSDKVSLFALPGNPASVMTCFYEYVYPYLQSMMGHSKAGLQVVTKKLNNEYRKKPGLSNFLKGVIAGDYVTILDGQESYKMNSLAIADCFVYLGEDVQVAAKGSEVQVHQLPFRQLLHSAAIMEVAEN